MGKFKNKKVVVKDMGTDDHGMPTINGKQATTFRKVKTETIKKVNDKYVVYPKKGGKRLGTHDSLTGAKKQLAAIEINKESINETSGLGAQGTDSRPSGTFLPKGAARKLNSNDGVNKSDNWYVNGGYTQMYFPVADDIFGDEIVSSRNTVRYSDDNTKNSTAPKTEFNNKKHNSKLDIHEDIDPYEIYGKSIMDNLKS